MLARPAGLWQPGAPEQSPGVAGNSASVLSGQTPKVTTGWMWDLTVPGDNDHDFYIDTAVATVLVHNCRLKEASRPRMSSERWPATSGRRLRVGEPSPLEWRGVYSGDINGLDNLVGMLSEDHAGITEAWRIWKVGLEGRIPSEAELLQQRDYLNQIYSPLMVYP